MARRSGRSRRLNFGIGEKITMQIRRQFDDEFYRLVVEDRSEFQFCSFSLLCSIGFEQQITVDDHAHWKARPDRQRPLDVEIAADDSQSWLSDE
jgi:hypothetical protein